jgi:hypothetical protein
MTFGLVHTGIEITAIRRPHLIIIMKYYLPRSPANKIYFAKKAAEELHPPSPPHYLMP